MAVPEGFDGGQYRQAPPVIEKESLAEAGLLYMFPNGWLKRTLRSIRGNQGVANHDDRITEIPLKTIKVRGISLPGFGVWFVMRNPRSATPDAAA